VSAGAAAARSAGPRGLPSVARPIRPGSVEGFTLLEVMVALAILAMGLMALSDVVSGALRNHVRAGQLDVATLLARGKLAELEDLFERKGFKESDQSDEGTFEEEGHPEVRWKVEVRKPPGEMNAERLLALAGGGLDLGQLLPKKGAPPIADPRLALMAPMLQAQLTVMAEGVKKGVREVRLTVSWADGAREDGFSVVTHLAVLSPKELP
jgi:general secretion pathway protein I